MSDETVLVISGADMPPYAVRGVSDNLKPIGQQGQLARTLDGELDDLSEEQFRKYSVSISCTDQQSPALDGIWIGMPLTIDCVTELCYKTALADSDTPGREAAASRVEGDYTFYRPRLDVRVTGWQISTDEYPADVHWQLDAEEI